MHSTIIRFVGAGKSARKMDMEEIYEGGCPSYADYTDELPSEQYAEKPNRLYVQHIWRMGH